MIGWRRQGWTDREGIIVRWTEKAKMDGQPEGDRVSQGASNSSWREETQMSG